MSQVVPLPPPPIGPKGSGGSLLRYVVLSLIALLGLAFALELRFVNSDAAKEALQRIRLDARVRAEFGDAVSIPFAMGWVRGDQAWLYGYVVGKRAHGYAEINLCAFGGLWTISGLEVHDLT